VEMINHVVDCSIAVGVAADGMVLAMAASQWLHFRDTR
jgi:hypothetical protein